MSGHEMALPDGGIGALVIERDTPPSWDAARSAIDGLSGTDRRTALVDIEELESLCAEHFHRLVQRITVGDLVVVVIGGLIDENDRPLAATIARVASTGALEAAGFIAWQAKVFR